VCVCVCVCVFVCLFVCVFVFVCVAQGWYFEADKVSVAVGLVITIQ
jgi:hypothetical protein